MDDRKCLPQLVKLVSPLTSFLMQFSYAQAAAMGVPDATMAKFLVLVVITFYKGLSIGEENCA